MTIFKPHKFAPAYFIVNNYEVRKFLFFFSRRVKVSSIKHRTGLCGICGRLEVEHKLMYPDLYQDNK